MCLDVYNKVSKQKLVAVLEIRLTWTEVHVVADDWYTAMEHMNIVYLEASLRDRFTKL